MDKFQVIWKSNCNKNYNLDGVLASSINWTFDGQKHSFSYFWTKSDRIGTDCRRWASLASLTFTVISWYVLRFLGCIWSVVYETFEQFSKFDRKCNTQSFLWREIKPSFLAGEVVIELISQYTSGYGQSWRKREICLVLVQFVWAILC